ncbi:MAG: carbohydrate-binding domain-containing protein, partial [Oscillospiraceae bacterium]|nr:carbohydrate-binding domain-containing protein [Oscillospiraceae bacterium]
MQTTNKRLIIVVLCALCALALALYMISAGASANNSKNNTAADGTGEIVQMAAAETPESELTFTFTDSGVTASADAEGYEIDGTALSLSAAGTYRITGTCSDGSITVKKGTTGVTLILDDLTLTSTDGSPLCCN